MIAATVGSFLEIMRNTWMSKLLIILKEILNNIDVYNCWLLFVNYVKQMSSNLLVISKVILKQNLSRFKHLAITWEITLETMIETSGHFEKHFKQN